MNNKHKKLLRQIKELMKTKDKTSPEVQNLIEELAKSLK